MSPMHIKGIENGYTDFGINIDTPELLKFSHKILMSVK